MSKDSAKKFVQAIIDDEELRKRTAAMKPEEAIPFAKEMGYDFTIEELTEVKTEDIELSPEELDSAAGGAIRYQDTIHRQSEMVRDAREKSAHCFSKLSEPLHDWVVIGHEEEPFLGSIFESGLFGWSTGYDLIKCSRCGAEGKKKV